MLEEFDLSVQRAIQESGAVGVDLIRAVRRWGAAMETVPAIQSMPIVLSAEQIHGEGRARAYFVRRYESLLARYTAAFADAAASGDLRPDLDARREASALLSHLDGIRLQWFFLDGEISMATSVATYVHHLLDRLAPIPRGDR